MVVHSLYIINKAGSLMYHRDFIERTKLDENDYLRIGSSFHAFYVISTQLSPVPNTHSSGIRVLETNTFRLHCFQSLTGIKFFLSADPTDTGLDEILALIYEAYCDFALKNPFYELEQVIKQNVKFDQALTNIVNRPSK